MAYGSAQAMGQIRAAAASLHHSYSNVGSKPHLQSTPEPTAMPDTLPPPNEAKDQTHILMDTSQVHYP